MRVAVVLVAVVLSGLLQGLHAQTRTDEFGYRLDDDEEYAPVPATDTTLFYNHVKQADDLYAAMAGHRLSFVQNRRRLRYYWQRPAIYAGIVLPSRDRRMLRAAGAERRTPAPTDSRMTAFGAGEGSEVYEFLPPYAGRVSSVGATFTDRGYSAGLRATAAAPFARGWSLDAAVEARTGRDLHIDGVFTNAAAITARIAKQFAGGSELSLLLSAQPSERGLRSATSAEAYDLTGERLYNPSWGWQDGRRRTSRVRREVIPTAVAAYTAPLGSFTTLTAAIAAEAGTISQSGLGWYDAATPMPDNYRHMPSYFTRPSSAEAVAEAWRSGDERYTQIDWEELYRVNRMSDRGAAYALEERVRNVTGLQAAVSARTEISDGLSVSYGVRARYDSERRFRRMGDLLGAAYLIDIDYYLIDDDSYTDSRQNDLRNPDRSIREGDRFGYDYALRRRQGSLWATADYSSGHFDIGFAARLGGEAVDRHGYYEKELFPGSGSYGNSPMVRFVTWGAAMSFGWTFTPQYRLCASLRAAADAPEADDLFLNPQYNTRTTGNDATIRTMAADVGFRANTPALQLQASIFAESQRGSSSAEQYYDDLAGEFCDMTVSGIDLLAYGLEAAASIRISRRWYAQLTATLMQCRYTSDPVVHIVTDRTNRTVDAGSAAHLGGCTPGGIPRLAATAAAGYRSANGWQMSLSAAWVGSRGAEPSMVRRTERVAYQGASSPESMRAITEQERSAAALNVDLRLSKRWFTGRTSHITASLAVSNLLGERDNVWSTYESPRLRRTTQGIQSNYVPLPTRLLYAYPRTIVLSATYTF